MENKSVLFVSESSLSNQILHSQGLPLLENLSARGYKSYCLSFKLNNPSEKELKSVERIKNKFSDTIEFFENEYNSSILIPNYILRVYTMVKQMLDIIEEKDIKVIHARSLIPAIMGYIAIKFSKKKIKLLYDNRGVLIEEEIYTGKIKRYGLKAFILRTFEYLINKRADAVVVVSKKFKEYVLEYYKNKIKSLENKLFFITNGTDITELPTNIIDQKIDGINVVYSGSASKWQYLEGIKEFIVECRKFFPEININIFSYNDDEFTALLKDVDGFGNTIKIRSFPSSQVKAELCRQTFAIMIREQNLVNFVATPLKFAEYLSAGLPIIISEGIGDTAELIKKHNVGVIVKNKDYKSAIEQMIELIKNKEVHQRCVEVVRNELDLKIAFDKYWEIYSKF